MLLVACGGDPAPSVPEPPAPTTLQANKLHWFIPDGMRADPAIFNVFKWADEGRLPNIKKLMDRGAYGFSIPTFPSHTPTNFATLLTGAYPVRHGVADGPMRAAGAPLSRPSVGGFSSTARKLPAVWTLLEKVGKRVFVLSVPGSTPPELGPGSATVRGRWGGWGADFPSVIFERESPARREALGRGARLFLLGQELTRFVSTVPSREWHDPRIAAEAQQDMTLSAHGLTLHAAVLDAGSDADDTPDHIAFSRDKKETLAVLAQGEWSDWIPVTLTWKELQIPSNVRLHVIRITESGQFRIRFVFDALNRTVAEPPGISDMLHEHAGPMVDFVDNFPAQLVDYPEDRQTFLDEATQSWEWHARAVSSVYEHHNPDVFIHDIYTPNQMLTSRWWMGAVDPASHQYAQTPEAERAARWAEVYAMYQGLDTIIGNAMDRVGPDSLVVLSSDHGAAAMNQRVLLNNLFAEKGWLKTKPDPSTGAPIVDWDKSRVVFLNMYSIYIHPEGLGGDWTRGSGADYEALRGEVRAALEELRDEDGVAPVSSVTRWEEAAGTLKVPADRVGDLLVANQPGFGWSEEVTGSGRIFIEPKAAGYKQSIEPGSTQAVWTPFVIAGPGIRAGVVLKDPIRHIDQLPTILTAMGQPVPAHVQGRVLQDVLK